MDFQSFLNKCPTLRLKKLYFLFFLNCQYYIQKHKRYSQIKLTLKNKCYPDGGSMWDLHLLDVCVEHAVRQTVDLPRWGRDAVLWAVHGAPTVRHVLKPGLPGLRKRLQSVLQQR